MAVDYAVKGDVVEWNQGIVLFRAHHIRKEIQRIHATVTVAEDGRILEEDDIQPSKREDRVRLANAAHAMLNGSKELYPKERIQHDLLLFCRGLWDAYVGTGEATRGAGQPPKELEQVIEGYVMKGGGTIGYATPGSVKSWTGGLMAVSVDAGISKFWNVKQCPVLHINLERDEDSVLRRLGCINRVLGLPEDRDMLFIHARGTSLADVIDGAARTVEREGVGFVLLDSLSRAGAGDLKDNQPANRAMDMLNGLATSWWAIAHSGWEDKHEFGSMMFRAAADVTVRVETEECRQDNKTGVALKVEKANDMPWVKPRVLAYEFDRYGLAGVRDAEPFEFPELQNQVTQTSLKDRIVNHLQEVMEDDATSIASATGVVRTTVSDLLNNDIATFRFIRKDGRKSVFGLREG
jgi:hypothetical protein